MHACLYSDESHFPSPLYSSCTSAWVSGTVLWVWRNRENFNLSCSWWKRVGYFWCSSDCCIGLVLVVRRRIRRVNLYLWKRNLMKMKPAHFTLVRFHHVGTSECLQHPGNKGKDLRIVQMLKGHSSNGLSMYLPCKKKCHLYYSFSNLKQPSRKVFRQTIKIARPSAFQQWPDPVSCVAEGTDSFAVTKRLQAGDSLYFRLI